MRVLKENGDTDYGRKFKLEDIRNVEDFRKRHPLTTYEDYKPFVERVMAGERGVMTKALPDAFIQTSGTTGPSKYFPRRDHKHSLTRFHDVIYTEINNLCPCMGLLQKKVYLYVHPEISTTPSGGSIRSAMAFYEDDVFVGTCYSTPPAGFGIHSLNEANYVHLLFALLDPNIGVIGCSFLGSIDTMMRQLERWWEDIVYDIEHGTINEKVNFDDPAIRSSLERALGNGQPERAGELRCQFMNGFDGSIMRRLWPKLEVLQAIDNSDVWPDLREKYAKGIAFVHAGYGCSEEISLAHSPWFYDDNRSMVFWLNVAFYEFIKLADSEESQPKTLLIDELEIGQEYEIVFTQDSGLYRYRVGDVVRITGYHYNCPTFEFMYRMGLMLNVRYEKTNQVVLKQGLQAAVGRFNGVRLVEYAVAESNLIPKSSSAFEENEDMPYYVMFLELVQDDTSNENKESAVTNANEITIVIDKELCERNSVYKKLRRDGSIARPRVHIVKADAFEQLRQRVIQTTNTTANQYKVQRRIRSVDTLDFMYAHVLGSSTTD
ncbi:indole-3-acetic acid-amido synthetase GH3.3-like [Lytechinus variegatus]|uniref:indole-3-acetic acid-amido synthetase GH3.3-like n=1 Tax=Lytechinus variegatus TaxID=7654 RepID=UPI001BB0F318|nr:indole-3-acetic acid-amido synthetase GH3.3-like [Lytechinus variegatus]